MRNLKKLVAVGLTAAMLIACASCGTENAQEPVTDENITEATEVEQNDTTEEAASVTTDTVDEVEELPATEVENITGALPAYEYPGPEVYYYVLYQYLLDNLPGSDSDMETTIPCPIIIYEDESDDSDIRIYGDFWVNSFRLDGDIMKTTSGGSFPGCIHMKKVDAGYEVTGMEIVGDGNQFEPTAKKIFGDHYDDLIKSYEDTEGRKAIEAQIIANYVAANNLSVTAYQDYGWDPVPLPEENIDSFYSTLN